MRKLTAVLAAVALSGVLARAEISTNPAAILQELNSFRTMGTVLYVAAHPDDENTLLIAYLARGRNYRMGYLSVTRGDGGQNVLGAQFDEQLGLARTEELLAARRLDGGRQFFTRAMDFGYSKRAEETLEIWDKQDVLSDVVRVIREFRPDVIINRFTTQSGVTHGHHTSSAILSLEAFKLAGDPNAFPGQNLLPWQPKRIFVNGRGGGDGEIRMDVSGTDPVTGLSFNELSVRSRAMHKTQGFDNFRGFGGGNGPRSETFSLLDGEPATNDIMDGIDTTWARVPGGAEIGKLADNIVAKFDPQDLAASVPALLKLRGLVSALKSKDPVVAEKSAQLDHILQSCLGLEIETTVPQSEVVPGEIMHLHHRVSLKANTPVRWVAAQYPSIQHKFRVAEKLEANLPSAKDHDEQLPVGTALTQPYWLRSEPKKGTYTVNDASLIGRPENPPVFPVEQVFDIAGQTLVLPDEPVQIITDSDGAEIRRKVDVIPPVSLAFKTDTAVFAPGKSRSLAVEITAARPGASGTLELETPSDWQVSPKKQPFSLGPVGDHKTFTFTVTSPNQPASAKIIAAADIGGARYQNKREEISYRHIPRQLLQPLAAIKAASFELATRGHNIGYLPGAGDNVAECLVDMGYDVTTLGDAELTADNLKPFDAVVIGVRAFNVRTNLAGHLPGLFAYVENGGTVVAQYNRQDNRGTKLAPFNLQISNDRVTDENAAMTFLAPEHPALNLPNKITSSDFDGWVQERGIYFPNQWDEHFIPILACNDPGESPKKGSLLVAQSGKGYYVYTGLDFFRELPAGVPGAYRLFANLLSLGK